MPRINNDTIVRANNRTKFDRSCKLDMYSNPDAARDIIVVHTKYQGKSYSANLKVCELRNSYGKAVKTSRDYGKRI